MLAAWFRMKYPHIIQGAHASSAPILFFPGTVSPYAFNELVTRTYASYANQAFAFTDTLRTGQVIINNTLPDGYKQLGDVFKTCKAITDRW